MYDIISNLGLAACSAWTAPDNSNLCERVSGMEGRRGHRGFRQNIGDGLMVHDGSLIDKIDKIDKISQG